MTSEDIKHQLIIIRESELTDFQFYTAPELWYASCPFRPVADGIPEASLTLRAVVERANGTFLPVAQPVIYGKRAYILMQFVPDSHRQVLTHSHAPPPPPYSGPLSQWNVRYPILTWRRSAHRGAAGPNTISKHRFTRHPSSKLSSMLLYVHRDHIRTTDWGRGAQDGHLDFYRAPELWPFSNACIPYGLLGTGSPGRPPRLSRRSSMSSVIAMFVPLHLGVREGAALSPLVGWSVALRPQKP